MNPERLPSTESPGRHPRLRGGCPTAATASPALGARAQLPARVHAHFVRARSREAVAIRRALPRPRAICRLLQPKRSVSTLTDRPNSDIRCGSKLPLSDSGTPKGTTDRAFSRLGARRLRSAARPPPRRPLVVADLPQPDRPGHPLSSTRAGQPVECGWRGARAVFGLFRTGDPSRHATRRDATEGRLVLDLAKDPSTRPHPGCLPPSSSPTNI